MEKSKVYLILLILSLLARACGKVPEPAVFSGSEILSAGETGAGADETVLSQAETVSSQTETVPSQAETVPSQAETILSQAETVPSQAETVPLPTETLPLPEETLPSPAPSSSAPSPTSSATSGPTAASHPSSSAASHPSSSAASQPPASTAHEHRFTGWSVAKEPSCTDAGTETRTCRDCGKVQSRTVPAAGHDWHDGFRVVREARTESVLVREAWDEQILLQEAYTEEITELHWFCEGCGMDQTVYAREHGLLDAGGRWTEEGLVWDTQHAKEHALKGESDRTYSAPVVTDRIEHPAEYAVIHHEDEYETVFCPEETAPVRTCSRCGAVR